MSIKPGTFAFEVLNDLGDVCCGSNVITDPRCPQCSTKVVNGHRTLRTAVPHESYAPPDPYAHDLDKMRAELPPAPVVRKSPCPFDTPGYTGTNGVPPDPYAAGIEKMRKGQTR